ncbi:molybdenum ABC transporter ATP-binding protein [Croceicoccus estronivorus]|uniref:molybdenum ABC transporter ATP-binding protein n=1 Tax=Croceicoccus estronivorus TaxID=1172626 RepID=UPI000829F24A|nr:ATP-binding cassette domain-containing protein [Croceicoccus estronivorus]OCC22385.1 molybdenum ABC transporter ATP-binding protein [Croceicoccus estronivorus]
MSFEVDVSIRRGQRIIAARIASSESLVALFGPSGAGKTSILEAIGGLLRPENGRIAIAGQVLFDSASRIALPPEKRACGYVFQDGRLFPHLRVRDNLLYGWKLASPDRRWLTLEVAMEFLGIAHLLDRMPHTLSGGEAQRVAIGRALLSGPRFLLMDEPLSSLDSARRHEIMRLIERIRDEMDIPILYVSHDRSEVERLASTVIEVD